VEVRTLGEILSSLDAAGTLDGMPFMPEMARYCGRRYRVFRRAGKTCVEGYGLREMSDGGTVFLEDVRCDGAAHEGCQRGCLIFWKEAWLRPVEAADSAANTDKPSSAVAEVLPTGVGAGVEKLPTTKDGRFFCQSTELLALTRGFPRYHPRPYWQDLAGGEMTLVRLSHLLWWSVVNKVRRLFGRPLQGHLSGSQVKPPKGDLGLQPGEWVEVKSRQEIEATLDPAGKNRGLSFESEMVEHCGRRYRVAFQVRQIINEETAQMAHLTNTVALDGVTCQGLYAKNCPRRNYFYWREIWLRRLDEA
jgi:hypothetical protein